MQTQSANPLSDQDKAYIKLLEMHFTQTAALLSDIGGTKPGEAMTSRELSIAYSKLEEAFLYSREYILRRHLKKAKLH